MTKFKTFWKRFNAIPTGGKAAIAIGLIAILSGFFWQNFLGEAKEIAVVSLFDEDSEKWTTIKGGEVLFNAINGNFDGHIESSIERTFVPLDLVLAIDNTGSMKNAINSVKSKSIELVKELQGRNESLRLGIINITDLDQDSEIKYADLSDNIERQLSFLDTLGLSNGGNDPPEDVYASLLKCTDFDWRDEEDDQKVLKVIVVITDNPPKKRELSKEEVAKEIKNLGNLFLLPIVPNNRESAVLELFALAELVNTSSKLEWRRMILADIPDLILEGIDLSWKTNNPWYWKAPKKYRTDWRPAYNQYITYSIKAEDSGNPFDHKEDIKIIGKKGQILTYDIEGTPKTNWTNYKITLNEMGGWILRDSLRAPTLEEFMNILGNVKDFQIRGDYYLGSGTSYLDNVSVIGMPLNHNPEPSEIKFVRAKTGYSLDEGIKWVSTGEKVRIQVEYPEIIGEPASIPLSYSNNNKILVPLSRTIHNPKVFLSDPILISHGDEGKLTAKEVFLPPTRSVWANVPEGLSKAELSRYPFTVNVSKPFGFIRDEVKTVDVEAPILPRFFVSTEGDISVDIATEKLRNARDVILRIYKKSADPEDEPTELYSQSIHPFVINSNPNSNSRGRWYTLNLNALIAGMMEDRTGLFDLQDVFLRLTLVGNSEIDYFSPLLDRYKQLDNIRVKAESLSKELTGLPLSKYLHKYDDDQIAGRSWYWFTEKAKISTRVTFRNLYPDGNDRSLDEVFDLYSLEKDTIRLLKEISFNARANEQDLEFVYLDPINWSDEQLVNFTGLQLVLKEAAGRLLEDGVQGSVSSTKKFKFDPSLSAHMAALLIKGLLEEGKYEDEYLRAAEEFLGTIPSNRNEQAALDKAREWKTKIDDFLFCLEKLDKAYEDDKLYDLYDLLSKESDNTIFHFGHPREESIVYDRTTGRDDLEIDEEYDLGKTSSEIFLRGLAAFGTTGRAAGDLPDAAKDVLEREVERRVLAQNAYRASQWKTPNFYSEELFEVDPEFAKDFMEVLTNRKSTVYSDIDGYKSFSNKVKGAYMEGIALKPHVEERLKEHKRRGRNVIFLQGIHIRTLQKGSQNLDGLILEIKDGKFWFHERYEVKSSNKAGSREEGIVQIETDHQKNIRDHGGVRIQKLDKEIINFFNSNGMGHLMEERVINGEARSIISLKNKDIIFLPGKRNKILAVPVDMPFPSEYERNFEVYRSKSHAGEIENLSLKLLEYAGIDRASWNRPDHNILLYWKHYQLMVRKGLATQMDRIDVEKKFLGGERFEPMSGEWIDIYNIQYESKGDDDLRFTNPYMSFEEYWEVYEQIKKPPRMSKAEMMEHFNQGKRYNTKASGRTTQKGYDHIFAPQSASIAEMERIYLIKELAKEEKNKGEGFKISKELEDKILNEFRNQIEAGKIFDWRYGRNGQFIDRIYPPQMKEEDIKRFNELIKSSPEEARQIRLTQAKAVASDIGASAIQALNAGLIEASRVANQRLLVQVRRMPGSNHTFITAQRREKRGDQFFDVQHVDAPIQQKLNLILWFERGHGMFSDLGTPQWLLDAKADGDQMDWYGNN